MTVVGITPEDAVDNFAILAALAGKAAEMATARITPAELSELRELGRRHRRADDVVEANRHFHRASTGRPARRACSPTCARRSAVVPGNYFELFPEQEERSRRRARGASTRWSGAMRRGARALMEAHVLTAGEALGGWLAEVPTQAS